MTVHDCSVFKDGTLPPSGGILSTHDVPVDIICTPTRVIRIDKDNQPPKPTGIYWNLLTEEKYKQIPVLREVKKWQGELTGSQIFVGQTNTITISPEVRASAETGRSNHAGSGAKKDNNLRTNEKTSKLPSSAEINIPGLESLSLRRKK